MRKSGRTYRMEVEAQTDTTDGEHIQTEEKTAEKKRPVTPKKPHL